MTHKYVVWWTEKYSAEIETEEEINNFNEAYEVAIGEDFREYEGLDDGDYKEIEVDEE